MSNSMLEECEKSKVDNVSSSIEVDTNNLWKDGKYPIKYPITLIGSQKIDGDSIIIYYIRDKVTVCYKNSLIPFFIEKHTKKDLNILQKITLFIKKYTIGTKKEDYYNLDLVENNNKYIKICSPILGKLINYCKKHNAQLALRGEVNGVNIKGSGNVNNPSLKEETNIKFYAVDDCKSGSAVRLGEDDFNKIIKELELERCKKYFKRRFRCKSDVTRLCEEIFTKEKKNGNIIEGVVISTPDGTFSAKYLNPEYSKTK